MGIGAGPQLLAFAAANEIVPKRSRGNALAFLSLAALPGSAFGSVIAYAIISHLSWRWTFYIGILSNGWALLLVILFYWPPNFFGLHTEGKTRWQQLKQLDFIGLLLFGGGLTSFILGVSFANNPFPWLSVPVLVPLILGAVTAFIALPIWEIFGSDNISKLCPPSIFKNVRGFVMPLMANFVSGMLLISLQVWWPQEVQLLFTTSLSKVGWYSFAYNGPASIGAFVGGALFAKIGKTKWQFVAITVLQTVLVAAMSTINQHRPQDAIGIMTAAAFCLGAAQIITVLVIQFGAADTHIGIATGRTGSSRATGGAVAFAIYGSIFSSKVSTNMTPAVTKAVIEAGLKDSSVPSFIESLMSGSVGAMSSVKDVTPAIIATGEDALRSVYADAFRLIYLVSIVFGGNAQPESACLLCKFAPSECR
ncbi:hypothetical protein N7447_008752 [Penicillium robsamsonii]|uniref:uncharacterized protein n=1 Tax=Penicillium robsamsonii TaxID=1792511 RepID=UPI0025484E9F|nr:uncharacterized protein N7447_008752 [Penicillium robsamsonii]KAJ5816519.1 hypothetical protein N7447_008752 [Penicillium robsamsonii]